MLIIVVIMGEFKSTIIFFACLTRRTTSVFHRARSLIAIQHASKQACWNCGLDGDEMRDVFPLVRFPNQIVLGRFTLLFVTCVPARHPHGRVYVLLYMQHMHGARRAPWAIIWLHAVEGIRVREVERWKQRLMRWAVHFCYQGAVQ